MIIVSRSSKYIPTIRKRKKMKWPAGKVLKELIDRYNFKFHVYFWKKKSHKSCIKAILTISGIASWQCYSYGVIKLLKCLRNPLGKSALLSKNRLWWPDIFNAIYLINHLKKRSDQCLCGDLNWKNFEKLLLGMERGRWYKKLLDNWRLFWHFFSVVSCGG